MNSFDRWSHNIGLNNARRAEMARHDIVLLDYETNTDVTDLSKPLSHASLVRAYLMGEWPG